MSLFHFYIILFQQMPTILHLSSLCTDAQIQGLLAIQFVSTKAWSSPHGLLKIELLNLLKPHGSIISTFIYSFTQILYNFCTYKCHLFHDFFDNELVE
jgi:hypothetical protein